MGLAAEACADWRSFGGEFAGAAEWNLVSIGDGLRSPG